MYDYISKELPQVLSANLPIVCVLGPFRSVIFQELSMDGLFVIKISYQSNLSLTLFTVFFLFFSI